MRVVVLGGTRFIGRACVERLAAEGHAVLVVHRGETEPPDLPSQIEHVHVERARFAEARDALRAFHADAALDCIALTRRDAELAVEALPEVHTVVLSSMDVYRAFGSLLANMETDRVPIDEASPVRAQRYPYRGQRAEYDDYDKLDVEEVFASRRATILRLPMVYGPRDRQRREEFILRRVRAKRTRIPFGAGTWLTCRGFSGELARATVLALQAPAVAGEVFNLAEEKSASVRLWAEEILEVAQHRAELVGVDETLLPKDLEQTGSVAQHIIADASKARALLGWVHAEPRDGLRQSVAWHLAHPPTEPDPGFDEDDRALSSVRAAGATP